ncbi:hypothetical protein DPMN_160620 [Dreissena polymorpha]|uniref:Uncharacterized protein n=1 Tax=Dreissena polymorpha TaxID=45954 RepID=A0A9D4EN57_DREPO|nr:hypothetical protein DPMN_160620 [Dreissena polymorpha]
MCKLDKSKDIEVGNTYLTDKFCQKLIKYIADTHRVDQDEFLKESPFIAIISDGSTDTASKEADIVFVRAAAKGDVKRVSHLRGNHAGNKINYNKHNSIHIF